MAGIMNDSGLREMHMRYNNEQEMQCDDSTIDDSGIQPTYSTPASEWNGQQNSYSSPATYAKSHSKGSKKVKSEDADEDIEIDNFVHQDVQRIPVKTLRKVIPKLRIAVYCSDSLTSGKRKLKHLWDERPADWPVSIPFKDPNNACKDVKKPGKDELGPMFNFLKTKYLENQTSIHQSATADASESDYSYTHQVIAESSTDKESPFFYSSVSNNPILPQIHFEQQSADQNQFLINPKPEPSAYVDIGELMNQDVKHPFTAAAQQAVALPPRLPAAVSKPHPVVELYSRLEKKYTDVVTLSPLDNRSSVMQVLLEVEHAVIKKLYDEITPNDTRVCLMFLDAGHQMEALLDVMLVLGQVDILLLQNGCQEIIKKFNTQNVSFVFGPLLNPPLNKREPLLPSSVASFKGDSDMLSDDDDKMDDIFYDLGILPYNDGKSRKSDPKSTNLENASNVQLFKPRSGIGKVLEDQGMGIQTRAVQPSSPESDDGKSAFASMVPVKGMYVVQNDSPPPKLNDQDKLDRILRDLQDPGIKILQLMNHYKHEGSAMSSATANHHVNKEQFDDLDCDLMLEDISDIIKEDQYPFSAPPQVGYGGGWSQETGDGQCSQNSQLLPSSATSATSIIPSMVEDLSCADSESEDSDNSMPPRMQGFGRGPTVGAGGGTSYSGRAFEGFNQWRPGN